MEKGKELKGTRWHKYTLINGLVSTPGNRADSGYLKEKAV
jgi:hypothetical protein